MLLLTVKAKEEAEVFFTAGRYRSSPTIILLRIKWQYLAIYICSIYFIVMAQPRLVLRRWRDPGNEEACVAGAVHAREISRTIFTEN